MNADEFRVRGKEMIDFIADYYENIEQHRVLSNVEPGYLRTLLPSEAPQDPESWDAIMADVNSAIMPGVTHWQSPNFFAYFPGNASYAGLLADMMSGMFNVVGFSWICSPACTELETITLDWLAKMCGLPDVFLSAGKGGGVIQGTASEALVCSILAARARARSLFNTEGKDLSSFDASLVMYASDQTHSSMIKASKILNLAVRVIKTTKEANYALQASDFAAAVAEDKANGKVPFFVCATVGTTSSTAVDDIDGIGSVCVASDIWMHIDAAYAGTAMICEEFRYMIKGVEKAQSYNFNPHKWMMVNFDCSALWLQDRSHIIDALSTTAEYLRNKATESGLVVDYKDWQIPLGRRFRSLKLWCVLRSYGVKALQGQVRKAVALAELFEGFVRNDTRFRIMAPRTLALVCFRLEGTDAMNQELERRLNAAGQIFLVHTSLSQEYLLRFVVCTPLTEERHVIAAWDHIRDITSTYLAELQCTSTD